MNEDTVTKPVYRKSRTLESKMGQTSTAGVAVIIAAWRASASVARAVESALAQPEATEVVVVDDASNDDGATIAAAKAADDGSGRLRIIPLELNGGPARARNVGIDATSADWIAVLDSDDYMAPGRLRKLLDAAVDGYDIVADDIFQLKEGEAEDAAMRLWFEPDAEPIDVDFEFFVVADTPRRGAPRQELGFIKPLLSRSALNRNNIRYDENMRLGEDYDLYARMFASGARMRLIPAAGYYSIWRAGSLSDSADRHVIAAYVNADNRLLANPKLTTAERRAILGHRHFSRRLLNWVEFMAATKSLRIFSAIAILLRGPVQCWDILVGLQNIVRRRLGLPHKPHGKD